MDISVPQDRTGIKGKKRGRQFNLGGKNSKKDKNYILQGAIQNILISFFPKINLARLCPVWTK